jgi:hypothetical protein
MIRIIETDEFIKDFKKLPSSIQKIYQKQKNIFQANWLDTREILIKPCSMKGTEVESIPLTLSCPWGFGQRAHQLALCAIRCSLLVAPAPLSPEGEGREGDTFSWEGLYRTYKIPLFGKGG